MKYKLGRFVMRSFPAVEDGGAEGIRTPDPHNAIVVLYQLSYDPIQSGQFRGPAKFVKTILPPKRKILPKSGTQGFSLAKSLRQNKYFGRAKISAQSFYIVVLQPSLLVVDGFGRSRDVHCRGIVGGQLLAQGTSAGDHSRVQHVR